MGILLLAGLLAAELSAQSPDRVVAEWMIRMGGSVVLEGERRPITDLAQLPPTDFRLHTLNFSGITQWASPLEEELKRLPPIPHLKELYLNGRLWYDQPTSMVASTLKLFAASTQLEKLILSKPVQTYIPLEDSAIRNLEPLRNLKEVRAHQTRILGAALAQFKLTYLDLNYDRTFDDRGMSSLANMPGRVAAAASEMYSNNIGNFVEHFWNLETRSFGLDQEHEIQKGCLITHGGQIVHATIRDLMQLRPPESTGA